VTVDKTELMGPRKEKNLRRVGGKTVVTLPGLRTWLSAAAMISEFPALRSLIILATALVLAYHPCRNITGLLAITTVALVGFVLLLDWGNRLEARNEVRLSAQLLVALGLLLLAGLGALLAEWWVARIQARFGKPPIAASASSVTAPPRNLNRTG